MCGRYAITTAPEAIRRLFGITGPTPNFAAHYNAAPGLELPVVRRDPKSGERVLSPLLWGLIPYWAKDRKIAWRTINARGETVKTSAAFKSAYVKRRCLVPADAFYEWKKIGKGKQPYAIAMRDRQPFAFARAVGEPEGSGERAMGAHLHHPDHGAQRARRAAARPHAGDPRRR
jgi:putative SOS response-associated peptidase YedK